MAVLLLLVLVASAAQAHLVARSASALQPGVVRRPLGARCAAVLEGAPSSTAAERAAVAAEIDPGEVAGLRVLKYPHQLLRAPNEEVAAFDAELAELSRRMFRLMYASKGVGLAAPQVGINKRLLVFNPEGDEKAFRTEVVMVNPKIVARSEGTELDDEGCLSFPGFGAQVVRAKWVKVKAFNLKGNPFNKKYTGWDARIFQHEYDHLDGTLYVDRLTDEERQIVQTDLDRLVALHGPGGAV